jgi:quercetin dioxygenase-like cupin family protein
MHVTDIAAVPRNTPPRADGPVVGRLLTPEVASGLTVVHVELPPGAAMPEHGHGASSVTLIPVSGSVEVTSAGATRTLTPGTVAHIPAGDRVALANPGEDSATLMITLAPPTSGVTGQPAA